MGTRRPSYDSNPITNPRARDKPKKPTVNVNAQDVPGDDEHDRYQKFMRLMADFPVYNQQRTRRIDVEYAYSELMDQYVFHRGQERVFVNSEDLHRYGVTADQMTAAMRAMGVVGISLTNVIREMERNLGVRGQIFGDVHNDQIYPGAPMYGPRKNRLVTSRAGQAVRNEPHLGRDEKFQEMGLPYTYADIIEFVQENVNDMKREGLIQTSDLDKLHHELADLVLGVVAIMFKEVEIAADEAF